MLGVILALIFVAIGMVAWVLIEEANEAETGTVTVKYYYPQFTTLTCTTVGKSVICSPITVQECYEVRYTDDENRDGDVCVDPYSFQQYRAGDRYPRSN